MFDLIGKWIWFIYLSFLFDKNYYMYLNVTLSMSSISKTSSPLNYYTLRLNLPENLDSNTSFIWNTPPSTVLIVLILLDTVVEGLVYFYIMDYDFFLGPILLSKYLNANYYKNARDL
jgi:hypothetical protein